MTKTILFFTGLFLMVLISCDQLQLPLETEEPVISVAESLNYKPNSTFTTDDGVFFGTLDGNQKIQGNLYKLFYADGTEVTFYATGELALGTLASDYPLNIGKDRIFFEGEDSIFFFENDDSREIQSASEQTLDVGGTNISFVADTEIAFHENGVVSRGTLSQDITLGGTSYSSGDTISFDDQGMVVIP